MNKLDLKIEDGKVVAFRAKVSLSFTVSTKPEVLEGAKWQGPDIASTWVPGLFPQKRSDVDDHSWLHSANYSQRE